MSVFDLEIFPNIKEEIDIIKAILDVSPLSEPQKEYALSVWVKRMNITHINLFDQPPKYSQGKKVYTRYYTQLDPSIGFDSDNLSIRKDFEDITSPREITLTIKSVDDVANTLSFAGNYTKYFEVGDAHVILNGTTFAPKLGGLVVQTGGVTFNGTDTVITYSDFAVDAIAVNDIAYFTKGLKLDGIKIKISWYDSNGIAILKKQVIRTFTPAKAAIYQKKRIETTLIQMKAEAVGRSIEHAVTDLDTHYSTEIYNYREFGDAQGWADAIDAETDPAILAHLAIPIPVIDLEGNPSIKTLANHLKDELYHPY